MPEPGVCAGGQSRQYLYRELVIFMETMWTLLCILLLMECWAVSDGWMRRGAEATTGLNSPVLILLRR